MSPTYRERALANDDERGIDKGDLLSGGLQGLGLCCEGSNVADHLSRGDCGESWDSCKGSSG